MKRGFIRALWGILDHQGRRFYKRRTKITSDVELTRHNVYNPGVKVYVFGKDNHKWMQDEGFNAQLLDDKPIVWDLDKQQFRHKLEVLKAAAQDFDQFVFMDWDMMHVKPLPVDFWEHLAKKDSFQAILRIYHKKKTWWRKSGNRIVPCGSFWYIGDKTIPDKFIKIWEELGSGWGEEVVAGKYTEDLMGGFNGTPEDMQKYWDRFEPDYFALQPMYTPDKMATKIRIIEHFNERGVTGYLRHLKAHDKSGFDWLQKEARKL